MNDIIKLLNIEDENIEVVGVETLGSSKKVILQSVIQPHYCSECGCKMHSRGIRSRIVRHPVLQDGYNLIIELRYRHWRCSNQDCRNEISDSFNFVSKGKRTTNATDLLIVNAFRDLGKTAADIGRQFHVSDHHAMNVFAKYVKMSRLPLPDIISVDEVYLDMDSHCKYVLVIQDFRSGDPIDIVISRRKDVTEPYFHRIPIEERRRVKYIISDMYNPYLNFSGTYFPNAMPIVDSFHVMQWIVNRLDVFLRQLLKKYKERDKERFESIPESQRKQANVPISDEVYLLQHYRWILLFNHCNIKYYLEKRMDYHFKYRMNTYDYEEKFLSLHPNLEVYRDLKEEYVHFNKAYVGDPEGAAKELDNIIDLYISSGYDIFKEFGQMLEKHRQPILNSFIAANKMRGSRYYNARLSNGPIESFNRKIKDAKRNGRGYVNFEHARNRILFATRENPSLNGRGN